MPIISIKLKCVSKRCKNTKTLTGEQIARLQEAELPPMCDKCFLPMQIMEVKGKLTLGHFRRPRRALYGDAPPTTKE